MISRIHHVIEMTFALAVGLAIARAQIEGFDIGAWLYKRPVSNIQQLIGGVLTGISMVEGIALWVEVARRRSPPVWGIGRSTWSLAGILIILEIGWTILCTILIYLLSDGSFPDFAVIWSSVMIRLPLMLLMDFVWIPVAFGLTARLITHYPRDPAPDHRELSGRIFAVCILFIYLFINIY